MADNKKLSRNDLKSSEAALDSSVVLHTEAITGLLESLNQQLYGTKKASIDNIIDTIKTIRAYCIEMDDLERANLKEYQTEINRIENEKIIFISTMQRRYATFKKQYFYALRTEIRNLVDLLCKDYQDEYNIIENDNEFCNGSKLFSTNTYQENEHILQELIARINGLVEELNSVDFDKLVPPIKIEIGKEMFTTFSGDHENIMHYDCNSQPKFMVNDPRPIRQLVKIILPYCLRAEFCLLEMESQYDEHFDIVGFNAYIESSARAWLNEFKSRLDSKFEKRFYELFLDEHVSAISRSFFTQLKQDKETTTQELSNIATTYRDKINIGDVKFLVESSPKHLQYIAKSLFKDYLVNGYLSAPLIMDLKKCGNILLNISEDTYSEATVNFINQLVMQFLISFPANRITFCLIDIDNKMGFSKYKILTKINTNILFNGIIRDDRQLENTIKDMEQTMYKVDDDILSINSVENIYEYNSRFEANPQNVHLFVLVNYPTGMRDDIAKRVIKIVQNGNKAGVFSIIINNGACQLSPSYKLAEHQQFIENVAKTSLVINKNDGQFTLNLDMKNYFVPKPQNEVSVNSLANVVEMLKDSAEDNGQKVVPLSQMFADTDHASACAKGIAPSGVVLDIPIGTRGGEIQTLCLKTSGDGSAHGVIIGGTGSGKSNLLHTIIMSACYKYSPEELNIYLLDLKEGVEFKYYEDNRLPHIKLLGVNLKEDLYSALAILKNLRQEVSSRGKLFKKHKISQIDQYPHEGEKLPRILVIIDEIQELFELDEKVGQEAILHLSELFKQGRAFGINILWASQNVPKGFGLKDKVLSQIGNRISLRLNEPEDASDIKIDPKVVKNLNRPEKGLGVINDMRYGNDSIEFRVAYAEEKDKRRTYIQSIIDKWKTITDSINQEPLFIIGGDEDPSPVDGNTIYNYIPKKENIVPKSFDHYVIQLGQEYVTGKPFDMHLVLRENKMNILLAGYDVEILRDMIGYATLSVIMNQMTNLDCVKVGTKIYYANGEMINPNNSNDLFNVIRTDFSHIIETVSSTEKLVNCIKIVYKEYKQRSLDSENSEYATAYTPCFVVIHSLQRYTDLFNENPMMQLAEGQNSSVAHQESVAAQPSKSKLDEAMSLFASAKPVASSAPAAQKSKMPDSIFFSDAFKELLSRGGKFGIHFIISVDNPLAISALKNDAPEIMYKVFVKGINTNVVSQMLGDYKASNSLNNPKVALVAMQDERTKIRVYRYDDVQDATWYKALCSNYRKLLG